MNDYEAQSPGSSHRLPDARASTGGSTVPSTTDAADQASEPPLPRWLVSKFGGTSVATAERWQRIHDIARARTADGTPLLLVASAVATVSDRLARILDALERGEDVQAELTALRDVHLALGVDLGVDAGAILDADLSALTALIASPVAARPLAASFMAEVMAFGERLSTRLGAAWLTARGLPCAWLDARDLLQAAPPTGDARDGYLAATCAPRAEPAIDARVRAQLDAVGANVALTQGFMARNGAGETVLLGRGGSDTSAAYLAVTLDARRLEIWTDVPGMFTADPRLVPSARLVTHIGYDAAEVLASMGAKVLHPRALAPARRAGIPLAVRCIDRPDMQGTRIGAVVDGGRPTGPFAVASRKDLTLVAMRREPDWQPVGFMADVAERFRTHGLSMDLVASSPGDIRATVDRLAHPGLADALPDLMVSLAEVCAPEILGEVASVSVVGVGVQCLLPLLGAALRAVVDDSRLHMHAHAANDSHVTWIVDASVAPTLVRAVHAIIASAGDASPLGPTWEQVRPPKPRPAAAAVA